MIYLRFDENGKQVAFCIEGNQQEGFEYFEAPEGFNPLIHVAEIVNNVISFSEIVPEPEPTSEEVEILQIKSMYANHEIAGKDYFNSQRASMMLDYKNEVKTLADCIFIEDKLKEVSDRLIIGDWMSALVKLENITAEGVLSQEHLNNIHQFITEYINANY